MRGLIIGFIGLTFTAVSLRADKVEIPASEFFTQFSAEYEIILSGTQVPKEENKYGSVSVEGNEGLLVFPYCHKTGGVCDPGFRSFPLETTRVFADEVEKNSWVYTLETQENEGVRRYRWEYRNQIIHFLDEQYTLVSGEAFPLEFIIEKAHITPPPPVAP